MDISFKHAACSLANDPALATLDATGWRVPEPQALRPILVTLGLISLLLLTWAAVQVA